MMDTRLGDAESSQLSPLAQAPHGKRLRFVASDAVGLPVKRKQVQQACLACRQKKVGFFNWHTPFLSSH
jgi:hypothetical protein